jgi:hypothetical protein
VVCDAGNDRAQIGFWIQPVEFRGFNDGVHRGGPHCETITQPWSRSRPWRLSPEPGGDRLNCSGRDVTAEKLVLKELGAFGVSVPGAPVGLDAS